MVPPGPIASMSEWLTTRGIGRSLADPLVESQRYASRQPPAMPARNRRWRGGGRIPTADSAGTRGPCRIIRSVARTLVIELHARAEAVAVVAVGLAVAAAHRL